MFVETWAIVLISIFCIYQLSVWAKETLAKSRHIERLNTEIDKLKNENNVLIDKYSDREDTLSALEIENEGLKLITHFTLPKSAWLDNYYRPMQKRLANLRKKYKGDSIAKSVFDEFQKEIDIYNEYSDHYSYEFFVMQKKES